MTMFLDLVDIKDDAIRLVKKICAKCKKVSCGSCEVEAIRYRVYQKANRHINAKMRRGQFEIKGDQ